MDRLKSFFIAHFEVAFVLMVLLATVLINFFIPYKLAFLNFYFLPVILAGYYLGKRSAILGAFFILLAVVLYMAVRPVLFHMGTNELTTYIHVGLWGCFLILAGASVGMLSERLALKIRAGEALNEQLHVQEEALRDSNNNLKTYTENLEAKVRERTKELEQSRDAIEAMKVKVENALYATMDPTVVNLMIEGQLHNEKRDVSVMFTDLVDFTNYSENNPPEVVLGDLNRFLRDTEPIISAYRGHIDKYLGDGIMCEFGAPLNHVTYRTMAVVAGIKLQDQLNNFHYPWQMRVGIASGSAFTGLIGHNRQTYTAIGDVVNLASRLEGTCTPGRLLVDRATYEGVSYFVEAEKRRELLLRPGPDQEKEAKLQSLLDQLSANPDDPETPFLIGQIHLELDEPVDALAYLEKAVNLDRSDTRFKLAYAEAGLRIKALEKISVKGKKQRVEVFEIVGFKDPLNNREKIPDTLSRKLLRAAELLKIPDTLPLPAEVLDDSVGHSRVVATLSYVLARQLGLQKRECLDIMNAAFLTDIGKEFVPPHILTRGGGLSAGELVIVRQIPLDSASMLRKHGYEQPAMIEIVTHANEAWNGNGYPQGLSGNDIPIGARIVAAVKAYDALTSQRPYHAAWARHAALDELRRETEARIYDPRVTEELIKLLSEK